MLFLERRKKIVHWKRLLPRSPGNEPASAKVTRQVRAIEDECLACVSARIVHMYAPSHAEGQAFCDDKRCHVCSRTRFKVRRREYRRDLDKEWERKGDDTQLTEKSSLKIERESKAPHGFSIDERSNFADY